MSATAKGSGGESLTVEKMYQKKSQLEHILLRPDTYIGSVEFVQENMWVYDKEQQMMVQREVSYVPGLYKIFDEILVNAADNKQRDPKMDCIKIEINAEANVISVWNNGKGIPVVEHKDEKMYVPTMIFGHLLTSSNYNDEEEKVTGGRNGYGAKLCNIFSTKFTVETSSKEYKRAFKQTWTDNMSKAAECKIRDSVVEDYTKITFSPDLTKFKMEKLDDDIVSLLSRRAYDIAASTRGVKVFLNGEKLPVKSFKDYIDLYIKNKEDDVGNPLKVIYENVSPRWEVALTTSEKGFQQVSFVNSIATTKGGRHVDYVTDALTKQLIEVIKKKNKGGMTIKPFQIKTHMWIFINCLIVNPTFDSQTKEHMTLQSKNFGSKCQLSDKFMAQVTKSGIIEQVLTWAKFKQQNQLEKAGAGKKKMKLKGIPKLEDANDAGSKNSLACTLILTEGDSAKSLAVSGLGVVGRDKYGVFPLRGKLLNVREATHKQILENAEINNIIKIMGLQYKKKYETIDDLKTLRYGKLMIMTDQDQDGSHIKGLIVNFIHHNWPSLIKMNFLEVFITPIIKATKRNDELCFYSIPEFDEWKNDTPNWSTYKIKYYKGLGTSTSKEAKEYFSNMERHRIQFKYSGPECDQHIIMAFSKKHVDQRKEWLTNWMTEKKRRKELGLPEEYLYMKNTKYISYKDFINKELVLFSNMDNERSIPSLVDGLKPGSRKVLFTCIKRNDKREIKVAQLAGSVAEHSAYHHGEQSLMMTIINLAQNFVGSNNINLLQPIGQFGTRLQGGKDAASPRYIFTMLSPLTRLIFHPHDDPLLRYLKDDNQKIEPFWYIPVIPMVLVNGADGIGTGWMTKIPNYNPRELIANLRKLINGSDDISTMKPWYKNFRGDIEFLVEGRYVVNGEVSMLDDDRIEITELPVGMWTQNYKETVLEPLLNGSEKNPAMITDFKEYNTDTTVRFVVSMSRDKFVSMEREGFHKCFKLQTSITTSSMCVFDKDGCLRKFDSVKGILLEYYELRMDYYLRRKAYLEGMLEAEANKLTNQARFIQEKCEHKLTIENKKKIKMIEELKSKGYMSDPVKAWKLKQQKEELEEDAVIEEKEEEEVEPTPEGLDYDYLLGMTMWTLTLEKKEELINKKNAKVAELEALKMKTPGELWLDDLDALSAKLDEVEEKERLEASEQPKGMKLGKGKKKAMNDEVLPSGDGIRVEPAIGAELKKKAETAVRLKEKKLNKTTKKEKESGEKDEFDLIEEGAQKSISARLGNSPSLIDKKLKEKRSKLKQSKLEFKKKENPWSDDSEDDEFVASVKVESPRKSSRQSISKVKYDFDSEEEDEVVEAFSSGSDDPPPQKTKKQQGPTSKAAKKKVTSQQSSGANSAASSDSEFGFKSKADPKPADNSNDLFDSLISDSKAKQKKAPSSDDGDFMPSGDDDDDDDFGTTKSKATKTVAKGKKPGALKGAKQAKEPKAKKEPKAAAPKKRAKKKGSASDSDDDMFTASGKSKAKKKKKPNSSDEDDAPAHNDTFDSPIKVSSRVRKEPPTYKFDDDDDDDF